MITENPYGGEVLGNARDAGWATRSAEVSLLDVLSAIRYGMFRHSYAAGDSARLARKFWDEFPRYIQDQIERDVRSGIADGHLWEFDAAAWRWLIGGDETRSDG